MPPIYLQGDYMDEVAGKSKIEYEKGLNLTGDSRDNSRKSHPRAFPWQK